MSDNLWAALIAGLTSLLVPVIIKILGKNQQLEIQNELSILKQLNSSSLEYKMWEEHVQTQLIDYAQNSWIRDQYSRAYRRYVIFLILLGLGIFVDIGEIFSLPDEWLSFIMLAYVVIMSLVVVSVLYPAGVAISQESKLLAFALKKRRFQREEKLNKKHIEHLEETVKQQESHASAMEKMAEEISQKYRVPRNAEEESATIYNRAIIAEIYGQSREMHLSAYEPGVYPSLFEVDAQKVVNEAYDYMEDWQRENAMPKLRHVSTQGPRG